MPKDATYSVTWERSEKSNLNALRIYEEVLIREQEEPRPKKIKYTVKYYEAEERFGILGTLLGNG
jgi:hypothetical protein